MKALKTTPCSLAPTVPKNISDSSKKQVIAISCECLSLKWLHGTCNIFSCCDSNSRRSLTCCSALAAVLRPDWTESFSPNQGWRKVSNFPFIWMASLGIYWKWDGNGSFRIVSGGFWLQKQHDSGLTALRAEITSLESQQKTVLFLVSNIAGRNLTEWLDSGFFESAKRKER